MLEHAKKILPVLFLFIHNIYTIISVWGIILKISYSVNSSGKNSRLSEQTSVQS